MDATICIRTYMHTCDRHVDDGLLSQVLAENGAALRNADAEYTGCIAGGGGEYWLQTDRLHLTITVPDEPAAERIIQPLAQGYICAADDGRSLITFCEIFLADPSEPWAEDPDAWKPNDPAPDLPY